VPATQGLIDKLDPRTGCRLRLDARYTSQAGVTYSAALADLGLRSRRTTRPSNLLTLTAASDEALVIDNAPASGYRVAAASIPAAITAIIRTAIPAAVVNVTASVPAGAIDLDLVDDRWDAIADLADRADLDVYDAGSRVWWITARPTIAASASAVLRVGPGGTITGSEASLDRADWYNSTFLRYSWTDTAGVDHETRGIVSVTSGPYAIGGPAGRRTYLEDRSTPSTPAEAVVSATAVLRRMVSRGRSLDVSAVSALWLRPGHTVTVQLPTGPQERHLVAAVSFDLEAAEMTVQTRLPDDVDITGE
jgi:hypothetical protein